MRRSSILTRSSSNDEQAGIIARAREPRSGRVSPAAPPVTIATRNSPTENNRDLHRTGLLGIAIPKQHGGLGADYQTIALAAAEIGRYCGATALTWNMHVCSTLWSGPLADDLDMDAATRAEHERRRAVHYKRIVDDGAVYSQPVSRRAGAAAAGGVAFGTEAIPVKGGWLVNGKKIFASLSGHADYYGVLCTEIAEGEKASRRNTLISRCRPRPTGVSVVGDWIRWACAARYRARCCSKTCSCRRDAALMPRGVYFQAAMRWPLMFLTLSPTYVGLAQAAYDFTGALSARRDAGHTAGQAPDVPNQADRGGADADQARADQGDLVFKRLPKPKPIPPKSRCCALTPRNIPRWKAPTRSRRWRSAPAAARRC